MTRDAPRTGLALPRIGILLLAVLACMAPLRAQDAEAVTRSSTETRYAIERDVPYRTGEDDGMRERCRLDLYHPEDLPGYATVVWFHGGGLTSGRRFIPDGLKGQGLAVVAADYRLSPAVKAPAYIEDAAAVVAWTLQNIESFGGSRSRVFVSGHSAGGYLASMVGLDRRWLAAHGIDTGELAGLVPLSGHTITHFTVRAERGIPGDRPVIDDLAPLYHVREDAPAMLLITGDRELEMLGRYEENAYLWRMMRVVGHEACEIQELAGFDHGAMVEPALPRLLEFVQRVERRASGG